MKIRRGFSLIELSICVVIIFILASTIAVNINSYEQTAKQEAEKLEAYIHDLMRKADRSHESFLLDITDEKIISYWEHEKTHDYPKHGKKIYWKGNGEQGKENPIISKGFTVKSTESLKPDVGYNHIKNSFTQNGHFTITRDDDTTKYYVYIRLGRVRISETEYDDE